MLHKRNVAVINSRHFSEPILDTYAVWLKMILDARRDDLGELPPTTMRRVPRYRTFRAQPMRQYASFARIVANLLQSHGRLPTIVKSLGTVGTAPADTIVTRAIPRIPRSPSPPRETPIRDYLAATLPLLFRSTIRGAVDCTERFLTGYSLQLTAAASRTRSMVSFIGTPNAPRAIAFAMPGTVRPPHARRRHHARELASRRAMGAGSGACLR